MNAETIAKELGGGTKSGDNGWWNAKCPAHQDTRASLGLKDAYDGGVIWACKAGCPKEAVGAALRGLGLLPVRVMPKKKKKSKPKPRIVFTYDYHDANGAVVFQTVRYDPKDFKQRRPDGNGGYIWNLNSVIRPLYRLPELMVADPADLVFLVEGEKDVDRLRSLGLVATTSSQGADSWHQTDHAPLIDRHVVLVPDNDTPGQRYAAIVGHDLAGKAASLRLVALPDLPVKGDVSDWLNAGGTVEQLREMAAAAPLYAPQLQNPGDKLIMSETAPSWYDKLERNDKDEARDILYNVVLIMRLDEHFKGRTRFNLFLEAVEAMDLPWRKGSWSRWTDADDLQLAAWCQERRVNLRPRTCGDGVQVVARDQQCHPVREWLNGLQWDGVPRLDTWLSVYMGSPDTPYFRSVGKAWLISGVARIMVPGEKVDCTLIFEGAQGLLKSTAAARLAVEKAWFADEIAELGTKDSAQDLRGKWIIEMGELSSMQRAAIERIKAFLSRRVDHYRASYGRHSEDHPRHYIFIGTTNKDDYLQDETGNRRFWPVRCGKVKIDDLGRDVTQLWAEAVVAYRSGQKWWLNEEMERVASVQQEERRIVDPWEFRVREYALGKAEVSSEEILENCIKIPLDRQEQKHKNRVSSILQAMKWERKQARRNGSRAWIYRPIEQKPPSESGDATTSKTESGDGKVSFSDTVTSVTDVTGRSTIHAHARTYAHMHTCIENVGLLVTPVTPVTPTETPDFPSPEGSGDTGDTLAPPDADGWVEP